ncbi:bifunctional Spt6 [Babesia duncani]|uniref:Bifunctional Spt6 n=1 Tax=Babesia duncani TaxID=323732 RepID=A0AAD9PK23_9APIC|nr:bifunctional Spt6 [Babesia duncani]
MSQVVDKTLKKKKSKRKLLKLYEGSDATKEPTGLEVSKKKKGIMENSTKDLYLDTMAEESEESDYAASGDEEDDEIDADAEIPDEMKGFIVDRAEESEVSEEASDVEYEPNVLDDDDLALIAENTGAKYSRGNEEDDEDDDDNTMQLRRLKKGFGGDLSKGEWLDDLDENDDRGIDLSDVWATVAECFGDVDLVVAILKNERVVHAASDSGSDDMHQESLELEKQPTLASREGFDFYADPDELVKEFLTKEDEEIRLDDQPERLHIRFKGRSRPIDQMEIEDEAHWLCRMLLKEFVDDLKQSAIRERYVQMFKDTFPVPEMSPEDDVREKIKMVLGWLLNDRFEVPFILYHKRHLICPPLSDAMIWKLYDLDLEWWRLKMQSDKIKLQIDTIGQDYVSSDALYLVMNFEHARDLQDVTQYLMYKHYKILQPAKPQPVASAMTPIDAHDPNLHDNAQDDYEVEQDIFGDFDNEHYGDSPVDPFVEPRVLSDYAHRRSLVNSPLDTTPSFENSPQTTPVETTTPVALQEEIIRVADPERYHCKSPSESPLASTEPMDLAPIKNALATTVAPDLVRKKRDPAMHLIESVEDLGLDKLWRGFIPFPEQFAQVLERSLIVGSSELKIQLDQVREAYKNLGIDDIIDAPRVNDRGEDEQSQIEQLCEQYTRGPYSTGKHVYNALVNYHAKLLANNIAIKRILREYYRKAVAITCTSTSIGEENTDVADPSWICRRLYRCPLQKFINNGQVEYDYPTHLQGAKARLDYIMSKRRRCYWSELYLELEHLQRTGAINVTIHPLYATEQVPWKQDSFQDRFAEWLEQYKQANKSFDENVSSRMAKQKALLEKEELMLSKAEEIDRVWRKNLLDQLAFAYCPSNVPSVCIFKTIQRAILDRFLNLELIPKFKTEITEELMSNATSSVLLNSQRMLQYRLDAEPHDYDSTLAMTVDDPEQGLRVHAVVVDEFGALKEYRVFENMVSHAINTKSAGYTNLQSFKQMMLDFEGLAQMISQRAPKVLLVALSSLYCLDLVARLDQYLWSLVPNKIQIVRLPSEICRLRAHVCDDGTNRMEHMAIALARWYINPLVEICNLWNVHGTNLILKMQLHPYQHLVSQEKLQAALENVLVDTVCHVGVELNNVKQNKHFEAPLEFVAGLGPRKRFDILRMLKVTSIATRSQLRIAHGYESSIGLGECVFTNCASFVKISPKEALDMLDTTRIHTSESAHIAEKLATDSLDEGLVGDEAIEEIFETPSRLDDLDLEAYATLLLQKQHMARMLPYLLFVKDELQNPYRDKRCAWVELDKRDIFNATLQMELKIGSHVLVRLDVLHDSFSRACCLPLGLKANIVDYRAFREGAMRVFSSCNQTMDVLKGTSQGARIHTINYEPVVESGRHNYKVDVTLTSHMRKQLLTTLVSGIGIEEEYLSPLAALDIGFSKKPLLSEYTEKRKIQYRRMIRHPSYRMWPVHKTVAFLRQPEMGVGECCICPSAEWDRLHLVIKTCSDPFNVATFLIFEKNQRIPGELGKELYLQQEKYDNLDQIIAQFCETLKLNLSEFYMHPKYKAVVDLQRVERDLIQESAMKPDAITWAIIPPNPKQKGPDGTPSNPLRFTLVVIPPGLSLVSGEYRSLVDNIYVDHKCFRLWTHAEKSLAQLLNWWKQYGYWNRSAERQKYQAEKQRQRNR